MVNNVDILFVDDNLGVRNAYQRRFYASGFPIDIAADPEEAINMMVKRRYDFVITDYNFDSEKTGIDLIKKVKEIYNGECKSFLISSEQADITAEKARSAGVTKILDRSFDIDKFIGEFIEK